MWTTGTASHSADLLTKLRTWATATLGWTELEWSGSMTPATTDTLVLRLQGPGVDADRRGLAYFKHLGNSSNGTYTWMLGTAGKHTTPVGDACRPGENINTVYLNLWNSTITYWFFGDDHRLIIIAKTSTVYVSAYIGRFDPFGTNDEYPYPLFVGGDYRNIAQWSTQISSRRMVIDPGGLPTYSLSASYFRDNTGLWLPVINHDESASNDDIYDSSAATNFGWLWPHRSGQASSSSLADNWQGHISGQSGGGSIDFVVPTRQGERFILPVTIFYKGVKGTLRGLFSVFGSGLASEQEITFDGRTFLIFQNIHRNSSNDFLAVEKI